MHFNSSGLEGGRIPRISKSYDGLGILSHTQFRGTVDLEQAEIDIKSELALWKREA